MDARSRYIKRWQKYYVAYGVLSFPTIFICLALVERDWGAFLVVCWWTSIVLLSALDSEITGQMSGNFRGVTKQSNPVKFYFGQSIHVFAAAFLWIAYLNGWVD